MNLKKLIEDHTETRNKAITIKKEIYAELSGYIKDCLNQKDPHYTENLHRLINKHYGFNVGMDYVLGAIEFIITEECRESMKKYKQEHPEKFISEE